MKGRDGVEYGEDLGVSKKEGTPGKLTPPPHPPLCTGLTIDFAIIS